MSARGDDPYWRMILDTEYVPDHGGEAAIAMQILDRLAPLTPGAQFLSYDMTLRGKHNQVVLRKHRLIPLVKVAAEQAKVTAAKGFRPREPKSVHVEDKDVTLAEGARRRFHLYAVNGAIGIGELDERGEIVFIQLKRCRTRPLASKDGYRWYNSYRIPKHFGGGGLVEVRMDLTRADDERGLNRTETVRVIPEFDEDFRRLSTLRRDAESINRGVKDTMGYVGRAHSLGHVRQHMNLIGFGLMVNSITLHLARLSAPPGALAA